MGKEESIVVGLVIALVVAVSGRQNAITSCTKVSDCSCKTDDGQYINLKSLGKVHTTDPATTRDYTWEPCSLFSLGTLKAVTAAQHDPNGDLYYDVGTDPAMEFTVASGIVTLAMTSADKVRKSVVTLTCTQSGSEWTFTSENPALTYNFELKSTHACPGVPTSNSSSGGLSIGSIVTITFFCLLLTYIIFGVLFKVFVRKAQGSERLPNRGFWAALPRLVKDGFKFTFTCGSRSTHYDQI